MERLRPMVEPSGGEVVGLGRTRNMGSLIGKDGDLGAIEQASALGVRVRPARMDSTIA